MEELIDAVATLPMTAKRRIISHAEGVPLYAIETVRALADRGVLVERDGALVLAGELGELDVPPSLISLLGARLDALGSDERELVRSVSVFGGNFPLAAVQALSGMAERRRRGGPGHPRAQAGADGSSRPALARPGAVPVQPDAAPDGRLRDSLETRAEVAPPRRGALPVAVRSPTRVRTSPRSWPRTTSRRIAPRPTTPTRPSSAPRRSPRCVAAPSVRRRLARPRPPSARTGPRSTWPPARRSASNCSRRLATWRWWTDATTPPWSCSRMRRGGTSS